MKNYYTSEEMLKDIAEGKENILSAVATYNKLVVAYTKNCNMTNEATLNFCRDNMIILLNSEGYVIKEEDRGK